MLGEKRSCVHFAIVSVGLHQLGCVLAPCDCIKCINKSRFPALGVLQCMSLPDAERLKSYLVRTKEMLLSGPRVHHICGLKTCLFLSGKEQPSLLKIKHVTWQLI